VNAPAHRLNHVDLVVEEIDPSRDFLARWFGMTIEQSSESICLIRDGGGLLLILRKAAPGEAASYPRDFHLGFFLPDEATVVGLYDAMKADGVAFAQSLDQRPFKFRCLTPAGLLIEVAHVPGSS
jgi:lactoylglutathione lyase